MINVEELRFILYVRKSTDSSDKQMQSLDDQLRVMQEIASKRNLNIIKVISESKSAKSPNSRDGFNQMIKVLKLGKADGVISYAFDRLSRNPVDSANIKWLLQTEKIKCIVTSNKDYLPQDNALLLSIEDGMANEYIRKLKRDVRRGLVSKFNKGHYPGMAPIGYRNCPYERDIKADEKYFPIVKKMWKMLLSEEYNVPEIHRIAVEEWKLKSPRHKKLGGKLVSISLIYKIFHNPFYKGIIKWDGMTNVGHHKPMVSIEEFQRAQDIIKGSPKDFSHKHKHLFTGIMRCPVCNCQITAETKVKKSKRYTYYYCTGRSKYIKCNQKGKRIRRENLIDQVGEILRPLSIKEEYYNYAMKLIYQEKAAIEKDTSMIQKQLNQELEKALKRKARLYDLLLDEVITSEDYKMKAKEINNEVTSIKLRLKSKPTVINHHLIAKNTFSFMKNLKSKYNKSHSEDKRDIFKGLGQNHSLKDLIVSVELAPWFKEVQKFNLENIDNIVASEPLDNSTHKVILDSEKIISRWRKTVKAVWKEVLKADPVLIQRCNFKNDKFYNSRETGLE